MTSSSRLIAGVIVVVSGLVAPSVRAQVFDADQYNALSEECWLFIERGRASIDAGDDGVALVFLDLGRDACNDSRTILSESLPTLNEGQREAFVSGLLARELDRADLMVALGSCEDARDLLSVAGRLTPTLPEALTERYSDVSHRLLRCLPPLGTGSGRVVELGVASPETWLTNTAHGVERAAARYGDSCPGTIPLTPTYSLQLQDTGLVDIEIVSDGDLVMVVDGPAGTFCSDDVVDLNPGLSESMAAGIYDVFIGEYARSDEGTAFSAGFHFIPTPPVVGEVAPAYGYALLGPGAEVVELSGHTYGFVPAATRFGVGCSGLIPDVPSHQLQVDAPGEVTVEVIGLFEHSALSLVLTGPAGTFCNEGGEVMSPALTAPLTAGTYEVYVGEAVSWGTGYEIVLSFDGEDDPPPTVESVESPEIVGPLLASIQLSSPGDSIVLHGRTGGAVWAGAAIESACDGFVHEQPDVVLEVTESGRYAILVTAPSDTTLAVQSESVVYCNDNWSRLNPGVFQQLEPGYYNIYVGSAGSPAEIQFEIELSRE